MSKTTIKIANSCVFDTVSFLKTYLCLKLFNAFGEKYKCEGV